MSDVFVDAIGCNEEISSGYVTFDTNNAIDIFDRSNETFWDSSITIHDNIDHKWALSDLTQTFIDTYGTDFTKSVLFLNDYDDENSQSVLPILVYEGARTANQQAEISTFFRQLLNLLR